MMVGLTASNLAFIRAPLLLRPAPYRASLTTQRTTLPYTARTRRHYGITSCAGGTEPEPVEDGVQLPTPVGDSELEVQAAWLNAEVYSWLESEWPDSGADDVHKQVAAKASTLYRRLRAEGIHDLGTLLLGIGAGLEGMDMSDVFIGGWNIANKVADLLLRKFAPDRFDEYMNAGPPDDENETESFENLDPTLPFLEENDYQEFKDNGSENLRRVASPSLADGFERYRFLQMVLDGSASKALIDGAVALAMGFEYDKTSATWNGDNVSDPHFKDFGHTPPDILGDENEPRWTKSLVYLDSMVKCSEATDGHKLEGLKVVMETLHGVELYNLQIQDEKDVAFKKRVAVTQWLHLLGGF